MPRLQDGPRGAAALRCSRVARGGGAGDDRAGRPQGRAHGPRAGNRGAQGGVRAWPADQGRTRRASGPGARRTDLRRPGRPHRRHPGRPGHCRAGAPARPARRRPLARAAVAAGICLLIAVAAIAAMWVASIADPGGPDPAWAGPLVALAVGGIWTAIGIMGCAVVTSWDQKSSHAQLPPRQRRDGRRLEGGRPGSTGRDPAPPGARTDQTRADVRAHRPGRDRQHSSGRGLRAPRGARPIPGPV